MSNSRAIVASIALVCASFTSMASLILIVFFPELREELSGGLYLRLVLFALLSVGASAVLYRGSTPPASLPYPPAPFSIQQKLGLGVFLVLSLGLHLFQANNYPNIAPDESHHLIVAKNLAEHGRYASGNPVQGFKDFDSFDSVGPAVIGPVALSFKVFGVGLWQGRLPIAFFAIGLAWILCLLIRQGWNMESGMLAALFVPCAFGSIYLSRTLYGEVPAIFYFCCGLLFWQMALHHGWRCAYGLIAGGFLGLAILSKAILLLSAFAFLGAVLYDWSGPRRIKLVHCVNPAIGVVIMLGLWMLIQRMASGSATETSEDTLSLYQHYLLFGLSPILRNLSKIEWAWGHLMLAVAYCWTGMNIFRKQYHPALIVLWLTGIFFFFWWLAFTPGQLMRYLYFSQVIGMVLMAPLVIGILSRYQPLSGNATKKVQSAIPIILLLVSAGWWSSLQLREVATNREMAPVHELAAYVETLPENTTMAVEHYPLEGAFSFLIDRYPKRFEALGESELAKSDVLIYSSAAPKAPSGFGLTQQFSVYSVFERGAVSE